MNGALEAIVRRDRLLTLAALAAITILAWGYLLWLGRTGMAGMEMSGMEMPGKDMSAGGMTGGGMPDARTAAPPSTPMEAGMLHPHIQPWTGAQFAAMFVMWSVMMIGMMTPSAAPMILIYARVARAAQADRKPFAPVAWFAGGYFAAWTGFSLIATSAQWALEHAALLSPSMAANSNRLGGAVLIAAGVYQLTPLKRACLSHCQAPLAFLQTHGGFRRHASGAFAFGAHHGLYCVGCCWALMALLFVGGVMNFFWIAGLTILVLAEKVLPFGGVLSTVAGVALAGAGAWLLVM